MTGDRMQSGVIIFADGDRVTVKFYDYKTDAGLDGQTGTVIKVDNQNDIHVELDSGDGTLLATCWQLDHILTH